MKFLQKLWIRVVISIIGGSMINNMISTSDPGRYYSIGDPGVILLYSAGVFLILTAIASSFRAKRTK